MEKKIDGKDQNNSILEIQAVAKGYTFHGDKINKTNEWSGKLPARPLRQILALLRCLQKKIKTWKITKINY